jgi:hypothetical protein
MKKTDKLTFYVEDTYSDDYSAANQIGCIVRTMEDARRLVTPIRDRAYLTDLNDLGHELEQIILLWDSPDFLSRTERAFKILDELDHKFTWETGTDMMDLGEIRVPLYALYNALEKRVKGLKQKASPKKKKTSRGR